MAGPPGIGPGTPGLKVLPRKAVFLSFPVLFLAELRALGSNNSLHKIAVIFKSSLRVFNRLLLAVTIQNSSFKNGNVGLFKKCIWFLIKFSGRKGN